MENNLKLVSASRDYYEFLIKLIFVAVFFYSCLRAYFLSITHDEALTYLIHASGSFEEIFGFSLRIRTNNHLLNTLLIKILTSVFGLQEFVIRIPSLVGLGFYLCATFKLLKLFLSKAAFLTGACLMVLNPYLLDFFSNARGYSLGLGFLAMALYYLFKNIENRDSKRYLSNILCISIYSALSVLSNLSFLNALFGIYGALFAVELYQYEGSLQTKFLKLCKEVIFPSIPSLLILFLFYIIPITRIIENRDLNFGGTTGFWWNTVTSLISSTLYGKVYGNLDVFFWANVLIVVSLVASVLIVIYKFLLEEPLDVSTKYLLITVLSLFICFMSVWFQNILLDIKFVMERYALYFILLFSLLILVLFNQISILMLCRKALKVSFSFLGVILSGMILFHYLSCMNIKHYYNWRYDADTKKMMKYLSELRDNNVLGGRGISLGVNWLFEPSIKFYMKKEKIDWINTIDRVGPNKTFDYYYIFESENVVFEKFNLKQMRGYNISIESANEVFEKLNINNVQHELVPIRKFKTSGTILAVPKI